MKDQEKKEQERLLKEESQAVKKDIGQLKTAVAAL